MPFKTKRTNSITDLDSFASQIWLLLSIYFFLSPANKTQMIIASL